MTAQLFLKIRPWTLTFVKDGGPVVRLDILDGGATVSGTRIEWGEVASKTGCRSESQRRRVRQAERNRTFQEELPW